jgi:ribonuclease Z
MRSRVKRSRIHSIFIGHLHGDHLYGIAGLLSSMHLDGREETLNVFGPEGIRGYLNASFRTAELQFTFGFNVHEFPRGFRGRVLDEDEFYVDALPLDHSIFCLGWRLQEKTKAGTFNLEEAQALGIPRGPMYGKLQRGENVTLPGGKVITPEMVLGLPRPGKSVAYCLDTQFTERSIELAENCTALIHESTFGQDGVDLAHDRKHSTMDDAARVAKEANVEHLIATHFSSRYDNRQVLKIGDDARSIFGNMTIGRDLLEVEI